MESLKIIIAVVILVFILWLPMFLWILYLHISINGLTKDIDGLTDNYNNLNRVTHKRLNDIYNSVKYMRNHILVDNGKTIKQVIKEQKDNMRN